MNGKRQLTSSQRYHLNLLTQDSEGVLGRVLGLVYKSDYPLNQVHVSQTDIHGSLLIGIELTAPSSKISALVKKLEKLIEVQHVNYRETSREEVRTVAHFRMNIACLQHGTNQQFQRFGVQIIAMDSSSLTIEKIARKKEILELYNALDGPYLVSFCSSSLITQQQI